MPTGQLVAKKLSKSPTMYKVFDLALETPRLLFDCFQHSSLARHRSLAKSTVWVEEDKHEGGPSTRPSLDLGEHPHSCCKGEEILLVGIVLGADKPHHNLYLHLSEKIRDGLYMSWL